MASWFSQNKGKYPGDYFCLYQVINLWGLKWLFNESCFKMMSQILILSFQNVCLLGKKMLKNGSWDLWVLSMHRKEHPEKNLNFHQRGCYCYHVLRSLNQMLIKMLPCCIVNATWSLFLAPLGDLQRGRNDLCPLTCPLTCTQGVNFTETYSLVS